jgi:hypothetical protein
MKDRHPRFIPNLKITATDGGQGGEAPLWGTQSPTPPFNHCVVSIQGIGINWKN